MSHKLSNFFGKFADGRIPGLDDSSEEEQKQNESLDFSPSKLNRTVMTQRDYKQSDPDFALNFSTGEDNLSAFDEIQDARAEGRGKRRARRKNQNSLSNLEQDNIKAGDFYKNSGAKDEYDFENVSQMGQHISGNASVLQTYFNMFKIFVGIGILATPASIR